MTAARRKVTAFRLDDELLAGIQHVWERDGITPSEQVRRALEAWLVAKGINVVRQSKRLREQSDEEVFRLFLTAVQRSVEAGSGQDVLVPPMNADVPSGRPFSGLTRAEFDRLVAAARQLGAPVRELRDLWTTVRKGGKERG